jgi:hypothetical protein
LRLTTTAAIARVAEEYKLEPERVQKIFYERWRKTGERL